MNESIKAIPLARSLCWTIEQGVFDKELPLEESEFPLSFRHKDKQIWHCSLGWACAEITLTGYKNHRYYPNLEEALTKESKNK